MTEEKLLIRILGSCETVANASVVSTDKDKARINAPDQEQDVTDADEPQINRKHADNFSLEQDNVNAIPLSSEEALVQPIHRDKLDRL